MIRDTTISNKMMWELDLIKSFMVEMRGVKKGISGGYSLVSDVHLSMV